MIKQFLMIWLCWVMAAQWVLAAETLYVTDRILLGIHQQADEQSPIIKSIPSGSKVTVISQQASFTEVKTSEGIEGWVVTTYLTENKPATTQYDILFRQYQKTVETLKTVNDQLTKKERELQIKRDQFSNAQTTIKELKKNSAAAAPAPATGLTEFDNTALEQAHVEIKRLKTKLLSLEDIMKNRPEDDPGSMQAKLIKAQQKTTNLQNRIELALANLNGEKVPSAEELAGMRPSFPAWYWGLALFMAIIGGIGGITWYDHRSRKRHGGFRV